MDATETTSWLKVGGDLLTGLDKIMTTEFEAKLLGRVGRGHLSETKFFERTLRWHEDELCFSWSGGTRYVEELVKLLGHTGDARDALEPLDTGGSQPNFCGHDRQRRLGQARLPVCSESGDEHDTGTEEA